MIGLENPGTQLYQKLPAQCYDSLRPCKPLREIPADRPSRRRGIKFFVINRH